MTNHQDVFSRIEWVLLRIMLLALLLIGAIKVLKVELSSLW